MHYESSVLASAKEMTSLTIKSGGKQGPNSGMTSGGKWTFLSLKLEPRLGHADCRFEAMQSSTSLAQSGVRDCSIDRGQFGGGTAEGRRRDASESIAACVCVRVLMCCSRRAVPPLPSARSLPPSSARGRLQHATTVTDLRHVSAKERTINSTPRCGWLAKAPLRCLASAPLDLSSLQRHAVVCITRATADAPEHLIPISSIDGAKRLDSTPSQTYVAGGPLDLVRSPPRLAKVSRS